MHSSELLQVLRAWGIDFGVPDHVAGPWVTFAILLVGLGLTFSVVSVCERIAAYRRQQSSNPER
jgi:hypothetical protein